jgi:glycosyltransferase involved in cell wall biosynthesis
MSPKAPADSTDRVLHVFQDTVEDPRQRHLGSTKGIRCRTDYFRSRGLPFDELVIRPSQAAALRALRATPLHRYRAVVFEHTYAPAALAYVRRAAPHARIVSSSHNAEFWHRLDILRADGLSKRMLSNLHQLVKKSLNDARCGRLADAVVCVSEWELANYWRHLLPDGRAHYMPWHLPDDYASELGPPQTKRRLCLCLLSTLPNPMIVDAARRFGDAVATLGAGSADWEFAVTGDPQRFPVRLPSRVRWTGVLDSPYPLLAEAKALALLSDYGFGFKTKVLEAILTGTRPILTPTLLDRMPAGLHRYCAVARPGDPESFAQALAAAEVPLEAGDLNHRLRMNAFRVLDRALGVSAD